MNEISTVDFFPFAWMIHLARALVFYNIATAMLKKKYNNFITFIAVVGTSMVYSYITLQLGNKGQAVEYTCLILYFILQFVIIEFTMVGKLFEKIMAVIFSFLTMTMSSIIYFATVNYILGYDYSTAYATTLDLISLIATSLFMVILSFVVVVLIKLVQKRLKKGFDYNLKYLYLYLFPITHFFGFQLIHIVSQIFVKTLGYFPKKVTILFCVYAAVCFLIDFSIIFVVDYINTKERENAKYKNIIAKNELDYQQFLQLKNEKERFRKIRHDIANILTTAGGFIEIGNSEKALNIIKNAGNDIHLSAQSEICKNETINTVYSIKHKIALEKGVNLSIKVKEGADVNIADYDLCRILTNLIDNQINAVEDNENGKSANLSIIITQNDVLIKGTNEYIKKSKKTNDPNHGYGQKIIADIAKKYNGSYKSEIKDNLFISETVLNNKAI